MPRQTAADLTQHLRTQLNYLRRSGAAFDEGDITEAARLAVTVRVLVHNTKVSTSLLKQLGVQHQLSYPDTARRRTPRPPGVLAYTWDAGLGEIRMDSDKAQFVAPLGGGDEESTYGRQPFRTWWNRPILHDMLGHIFKRSEVVLFLAQKLGGAHVDPKLPVRFEAMTKLNSLGWGWTRNEKGGIAVVVPAGPSDEPMGSAIPVNVRQIAFELESAVMEHLSERLE